LTPRCNLIYQIAPWLQLPPKLSGVILCCSSLFNLTFSIAYSFLIRDENTSEAYSYGMFATIGFQYFIFAWIFVLDRINIRLTVPRVEERISVIRNVFQWILSPVVILGYSLVEFYALHEVMVKGKEVCKHGASKKEVL
jgi:hypothetical protein